jgi:hydrogenase maturation protease
MNLPPGEWRVVTPRELCDLPAEHRASMHDVPFVETLTLVGRFFHRPEDVRILAIQPKAVDYGRELTPDLAAALPAIAAAGVRLVEEAAGLAEAGRQGSD